LHVVVLMCLASTTSLAGIRGGQDSVAGPLYIERDALLETFCIQWSLVMGRTCRKIGRAERCRRRFGQVSERESQLRDVDVEGRIILKLRCDCGYYSCGSA
jgi:hypothetical protein